MPNTRLMTLPEAAESLHGAISVEALRREVRRGNLRAAKYGTNRYFVTPEALEEFVHCQENASPPASTSAPTKGNGSSETAASRSGQDMARASVEKLKQLSRTTSPKEPCRSAAVLPIRGS